MTMHKLPSYVLVHQLTPDLGGTLMYRHEIWLHNRIVSLIFESRVNRFATDARTDAFGKISILCRAQWRKWKSGKCRCGIRSVQKVSLFMLFCTPDSVLYVSLLSAGLGAVFEGGARHVHESGQRRVAADRVATWWRHRAAQPRRRAATRAPPASVRHQRHRESPPSGCVLLRRNGSIGD